MAIRVTRVHNPVAAYNRRRPIVEKPSKGKGSHNRQKDENNAIKYEQNAYKKGE